MVDLSKAKTGDKVKFRCGGEAEIFSIKLKHDDIVYHYGIVLCDSSPSKGFPGRDPVDYYQKDGTCKGTSVEYPLDIIAIEPPPFDWSMARPGMAFYSKSSGICIYQGPYVTRNGKQNDLSVFWFQDGNKLDWRGSALIRSPEHDIEVDHG